MTSGGGSRAAAYAASRIDPLPFELEAVAPQLRGHEFGVGGAVLQDEHVQRPLAARRSPFGRTMIVVAEVSRWGRGVHVRQRKLHSC